MLFKPGHITLIRRGIKTVTRRDWDENYAGPNVGSVVRATTEMFTPTDECDCFIEITGHYRQALGAMTAEDARKEGDYGSVGEFQGAWEEINGDGSWDPKKEVDVVEFEYVGRTPERKAQDVEAETQADM